MQFSLKYRPTKFSEVVGHEVNKRILINSILMDRVPAAILMSGMRGCGKTTLARIYAKSLNCEHFKELSEPCCECVSCENSIRGSNDSIIEIDSASNSGVDDVRQLEEVVNRIRPGIYTVVILDECHMLTKQAQAALLKGIEEPRGKIVYVLVTTSPEKLESTIRSRCLSLPFRPLSEEETATSIRSILEKEGVTYDEASVGILSSMGGGSLRDVQQVMEQAILCTNDNVLSSEVLYDNVGVLNPTQYKDLVGVLDSRSTNYCMNQVEEWYRSGVDLWLLFSVGIPNVLRDFSIHLSGSYSEGIKYYSGISEESFRENLGLTLEEVRTIYREWESTYNMMKFADNQRVIFLMYMAKICNGRE